jgi:enoyl-CoA hydratase/carnithine racemase
MIEVEKRGAGLWIFMNRPDVLNALHPDMIAAINQTLNAAAADADLRAIVLSGRGRAFCAGADLKYNQSVSGMPGGNVIFVRAVSDLTVRLEDFPLPVLAAVNGTVVAGGLELALGCDLIVAAESAKLGDMHANYSMFPGGGASVRLTRRIGAAQAKRLMLWGETISASQAHNIGLVDLVVNDSELQTTVDGLVSRLTDKSPLVLRRMKSAINRASEMNTRLALEWERDMNELHSHSHDRAEGLRAFSEKRKPQFFGR